ncbi:Ail/Lom family outer membrane beta-barrel protein [Photorhabdus bodei]|uniref:Outer membrane beta-barrel protein n=1 Tax=Photorhabdus bodei TaxID=2029681 RepID=A0ABX0AHP6_9GAMM|nr:Ail/Lom family outer membrane beta-barrel protein [Photorhabdus bodei]NDK98247.1 outer membrane beta-barrel protein [Photorhabdus bodei]NDL02498.1 outer membrane beta-barrel protein [Photorhabdus bodei]NDL06572.1 outer membrane beta-barrel protein [Photorhabdus bodei]
MQKLLLSCGVIFSVSAITLPAQAEQHTASIGYAYVKPQDVSALNGATLSYRYELDDQWGLLSSFTFAKGDEKETTKDYHSKGDIKYYSLMAGPTYRINNYISLYGQLGLSRINAKSSTHYRPSPRYSDGYIEKETVSKNTLGWGAGFIINPTTNTSITAGYEGSRFSIKDGNEKDHLSTNGFNITVGYRF